MADVPLEWIDVNESDIQKMTPQKFLNSKSNVNFNFCKSSASKNNCKRLSATHCCTFNVRTTKQWVALRIQSQETCMQHVCTVTVSYEIT